MKISHASKLMAVLLAGAGLALAGCSERTSESVGKKLDTAVDSAKQQTDQAVAAMKDAGSSMKDAAKDTAADASRIANDATITASIKVDLAKDPGLSALKIDVNTVNGVVTLQGEADNEAARQRAESLARNIVGVVKVNNEIRTKTG